MSRNNTKQPMKYCKVCHDAGKPESLYRSHFVRASAEPGAKVVCPTLLAQECRYCFKAGHTAGYCPTIKANKKNAVTPTKKLIQPQQQQPTKKPSNAFDALYESDDDERPTTEATTIDEFPALQTVTRVPKKTETGATATAARPSCISAIQSLYTGLTVQKSLPEVPTYRPPVGRLVRKREEEDPKEEEYQDEAEEEEQNDDIFDKEYRARLAARPRMLASEMDWAAVDDDDDNEDW